MPYDKEDIRSKIEETLRGKSIKEVEIYEGWLKLTFLDDTEAVIRATHDYAFDTDHVSIQVFKVKRELVGGDTF